MASARTNGSASRNRDSVNSKKKTVQDELLQLNLELKNLKHEGAYAKFHGDNLIGDKCAPKGTIANLKNTKDDILNVLAVKNWPTITKVLAKYATFQGLDVKAAAPLVAAVSNDSNARRGLVEAQVKSKYDKMLHPPLTYLGDAFQYRTPDGKFNNVMSPHLGQAGAPYAKSVPSKTHQLGALPDPGDLFDRLMARQEGGRQSKSGLSSMLVYHATIIIHDIFRTNDNDKNISDSSSYLDLSPLYGYTMEMQRKIRDDKYKLGLLKPDTFAEDRLLRQPPGVCIMLVMYNRYHNYAATQLRRINENGRFSVPRKYEGTLLEAVAKYFYGKNDDAEFNKICVKYNAAWKDYMARQPGTDNVKLKKEIDRIRALPEPNEEKKKKDIDAAIRAVFRNEHPAEHGELDALEQRLEEYISACKSIPSMSREQFETGYRAAWDKLDDDLFNTARLITCGMYIQIAIHDYLRALMGFHQWNTNFTLDPRLDIDHHNVSRGIGNQVTVEFNLLYRFHCAISVNDEQYTKKYMTQKMKIQNPDEVTLGEFMEGMKTVYMEEKLEDPRLGPHEIGFGIKGDLDFDFYRNPITGLFDDQKMIDALTKAMDDPISNFGPRNVPKCLKPVEIMGILQARKWEIGTLNDFREFFGMSRHETFESITKNVDIQNALRDLYDHPDKVELYPGVFCESDADMGLDPGPSDVDSALWSAIFSDAITLVRSDRFYTTDWNTNSLTSWGMKEVTPDNDTCKSSVFHRLVQRAFPEWFPYDSVQFFHPFYTRQTNAKFAHEQGYAKEKEFRMSEKEVKYDEYERPVYDVSASKPSRPWKPVYLADPEKISAILSDPSNFVHPAFKNASSFPDCFQWMFDSNSPTKSGPHNSNRQEPVQEDVAAITQYFTKLMRTIIKRESITMNNTTLQIDATRDFAIPVVTQYVADFLGFGHLIRNPQNLKAPYSENEIYQHITNCQVFLSYNTDETKLLKRRKAFKKSMETLHGLVRHGYIGEANRYRVTRFFFSMPRDNAMRKLGYEVAERVISHTPNVDQAASIMVLVGLNTAYNAVLSFTAALDKFLQEMYNFANPHKYPHKQSGNMPAWLTVQELAFKENDMPSEEELGRLVQDAARRSIKLPLVRVALQTKTYTVTKSDNEVEKWTVEKDHKVILDTFKANQAIYKVAADAGKKPDESDFIAYKFGITDGFADYHPKQIANVGVTAMMKIFAQMRNVRRGHHVQGRLKRVKLDASAEGYTNYMAPMRIQRIQKQVEMLGDETLAQEIYTKDLLKPETDTYLTAEWDEMVPFPNTWKLRYDGFGRSNYTAKTGDQEQSFGMLREPEIVDDAPPYYQPRGPSHTGGTFADVACVCGSSTQATKDIVKETQNGHITCPAELEPTVSYGCGIGR